ncbi:hypothetical protein ACTXT7_006915 [Hymenolepis weldensis]
MENPPKVMNIKIIQLGMEGPLFTICSLGFWVNSHPEYSDIGDLKNWMERYHYTVSFLHLNEDWLPSAPVKDQRREKITDFWNWQIN